MKFQDLHIIEPILSALIAKEYEAPTPIQIEAIPLLLEGKDILGSAQTGTGKTAAFAIPILQRLYIEKHDQSERDIKALILAPTRELALQIHDNFMEYGKNIDLRTTVIYGGVSQSKQVAILQRGIDILVATPGRLLDLIQQNLLTLARVSILVLDEADRMLDMGFVKDVKKIIAMVPKARQTMLFSATIPPAILSLASEILHQPERISVTPEAEVIDKISQSIYHVHKKTKMDLLIHLLSSKELKSVLVFSKTKHGANRIVKTLIQQGIPAVAIHGNKSQGARQEALFQFKAKKIRVLVATDIAARGIDIDELSHVINFDLPDVAETYIHRMGRTGRAGLGGVAISFCSEEEMNQLHDIQKYIKMNIPVVKHAHYSAVFENTPIKQRTQNPSARAATSAQPTQSPKKKMANGNPRPKHYSKYDQGNQNKKTSH